MKWRNQQIISSLITYIVRILNSYHLCRSVNSTKHLELFFPAAIYYPEHLSAIDEVESDCTILACRTDLRAFVIVSHASGVTQERQEISENTIQSQEIRDEAEHKESN
jgi:hypothetical protein